MQPRVITSPMAQTLFEKVWDAHAVRSLANGQTQLLVGTHLIHEVTSPQAFGMMRDLGLKVAMPHRTFATVDHIVPTDQVSEPFADPLADAMIKELRRNCAEFGITFFDRSTRQAGDRPHRRARSRASPSPAPPSPAATPTRARTGPSARSPSASARPRYATSSPPRPWRSAGSRSAASRSTAGCGRASTRRT